MIEQQVNKEVAVTGLERILAADKGEPLSQFQQKLAKMLQQSGFQMLFVGVFA